MYWFLRIHYLLVLPSAIVMPVLTVLLLCQVTGFANNDGSLGVALITFLFFCCFFFGQIIAFVLIRLRPLVAQTRTVGSYDALILTILYLLILLFPIFLPGVDPQTGAEKASIATRILGDWTYYASELVTDILFFAIPAFYFYCLVVFIFELKAKSSIEIELPTKSF